VLLAAGVGAGVGSIFRAPLAGALFAAEVLYSDPEFESDVIIPAALASIVAYCVYSLKFGFGTLFETPRFEFRSALELAPYTVLALLVAISAGVFVRVFYGVHDAFRRLPIPPVWRPAIGGLATGSLALVMFIAFRNPRVLDVLSFGYGSIQEALHGNLPLGLLVALAAGKILTTSFSIGSGGSGGVFGPSMVIGGSLGGAVGLLAQQLMPHVVTQPGAYVAVGMAGFFAAAANAPVSTLVMVSEMTGNYQLLLPALWVCALSYLIGRRWTLYRSQVPSRLESPAHWGVLLEGLLKSLSVGDILSRRSPRTVRESAPLPEVVRTFARVKQSCLPVVNDAGRLTGMISLDQVQELLDHRADTAAVIAFDLASRRTGTVTLNDGLDVALEQLEELDAAELPVVAADDPTKLVGLVSRREILAAYRQRRLGGGKDTPA
jgi:CIC family chloride channel protein